MEVKSCKNMVENKISKNADNANQYFVIHTEQGKEDSLVELLKEIIPKEVMQDCFVIKRERIKKFRGNWELLTENLFPEYVFVKTDRQSEMENEIQKTQPYVKKENGYLLIPASASEAAFIDKAGDRRGDHTICLSKLYMNREDDSVIKIEGDLDDFKDRVKKIDKRNRHAVVEIDMFGKKQELYLGFEFGSE